MSSHYVLFDLRLCGCILVESLNGACFGGVGKSVRPSLHRTAVDLGRRVWGAGSVMPTLPSTIVSLSESTRSLGMVCPNLPKASWRSPGGLQVVCS